MIGGADKRVAVKKLRTGASTADAVVFAREIQLLQLCGPHKNIVGFAI